MPVLLDTGALSDASPPLGIFFLLTVASYLIASGLFLAFVVKGRDSIGRAGTLVFAVGVIWQVISAALEYSSEKDVLWTDIDRALDLLSLLIAIAFLITSLIKPIRILGVFIAPITLLFFLGSTLSDGTPIRENVRSAILPFHVAVNVLGVVAFTIACTTAIAYVIQENLLRKRKLTGLFQRLPALDVLDSLSLRLVIIGFPLLTIGIVSGAIFARDRDPGAPVITGTQAFAILAWIVFGSLLVLRASAGWRGRRAAIGTMAGFGCAALVLLGYFVRSLGAS